ncbi:hypothetical protein ARMSODRAFT_964128 [Armillaria solidipes]|uniref:Uncharacterized protein n=1 Tax=Armillaria solidipes TaxID=1076256 RepID=A0A2H3AUM4_9AGAR|nr:hypothetical protein ARMSODRAFT_964128 [Armillaria solidipes]
MSNDEGSKTKELREYTQHPNHSIYGGRKRRSEMRVRRHGHGLPSSQRPRITLFLSTLLPFSAAPPLQSSMDTVYGVEEWYVHHYIPVSLLR